MRIRIRNMDSFGPLCEYRGSAVHPQDLKDRVASRVRIG